MIRPSGAHCWVVCTGQPALVETVPALPDDGDDVTAEGTAAHELAAVTQLHHGGTVSPAAEGASMSNGVTVTAEMLEGVQLYLDVINGWCEKKPNVEAVIPLDCIYPGMTGTADSYLYDAGTKVLYVADFKFGYRYVDVFMNWQLIAYVAGILVMLKLDDLQTTVVLTIVQPRSYHSDGPVRTWRINAASLRAHINYLSSRAHDAMSGNGQCVVSPACLDCPAAYACRTLQEAALNATSLASKPLPMELPPVALGNELRRLEFSAQLIEARINGLRAQATHVLSKGNDIPHYTMRRTTANESWKDEADAIRVAKLMGIDVLKPPRAITPTQARKKLPAKLVDTLAHRLPGAAKLVHLDANAARRIFDINQ